MIKKILLMLILAVTFVGGGKIVYAEGEGDDSSGYTQEQKDAAKAWLSAHGYAPTRAGAAQAYQDFLDGKLDNDPDVRRYKGLDAKTEEESTTTEHGESPQREKKYAQSDEDAGEESVAQRTGDTLTEPEVEVEVESADSQVDMESLEDIMKKDFEDELRADTKLRLTRLENKDMYLIYDKYEKKNTKNDTQFYIIISVIIVMVLLAVFFLLRTNKDS